MEKPLIKCPCCHGEGGWDSIPYQECSYCKGRGYTTQGRRMEFVRSFIGLDKKMRDAICWHLRREK